MNHTESKSTILVAEDDKDDQELLLYAFGQITDNYNLTIVENGRELIDVLSKMKDFELPSLIILDYNMPELNGKQTLKLLQVDERYLEIPKVIFTTSNSKIDRLDCLSIGANDYLVKPADLKEFVASARQMLGYCRPKN